MNEPADTILYVVGTLEIGGAERHLAQVSTDLRRKGWGAEIFVFFPGGSLEAQVHQAGVPIHGIDTRWVRRRLPRGTGRTAIQIILVLRHLVCVLRRRRPAVVHFFLPHAYVLGGIASLAAGARALVMSRRSLRHYQEGHPFSALVERLLHPRMDLVCGNSRAVTGQLAEEGVPPDRLRLIYNGIDVRRFEGTFSRATKRAEIGVPEGALVITTVANLIPYKGHADLLDALAGVSAGMPEGWTLLCVGRDDGIGLALMERGRQGGIAENVRWLGPRSDVEDILRCSDIGVLCSHQEGFSNAVLEGMAASLPMVVTDVGGNAEAVADGETGVVVPARDPQALGQALLHLAHDPDRSRLGRRGRERVERLFSMQACLDGYERLYRELLPGSSANT